VDQAEKNLTAQTYCNMRTFEFDDSSMSCENSSLQDYLSERNLTSNSITAYLSGSCTNADEARIKVEFIFFGGGSDKVARPKKESVPLPRKQVLLPGYWTMQIVLTDVSNNASNGAGNKSYYLTRYRSNLQPRNDSLEEPLMETRGLFYPFSIPFYTSYSCLSHQTHLWNKEGNPNRFVATNIPFNFSFSEDIDTNITDGPLLQFVGLQVQAFGIVYGAKPKGNTTLLSFSSVYDCEGYFSVMSWTGTFVVGPAF
jgi:hypothetical protein